MQVKLKPLPASFLPGDKPLKYIDSQTSKQVNIQKRFYQKGFYKQQGKFSRALSHLLDTKKLWQTTSDEDSVHAQVMSNNTIDMSNIDFDIPAKKAKVVIPQSALESKTKFCDFLFEEEKSIPREITDTVQQLHTTETNINTLDGNDSYTTVIN